MPILTLQHCLLCFKINNLGANANTVTCAPDLCKRRNGEICHRFCSLVFRYLQLGPDHFMAKQTIKTKFGVSITHVCDECAPVMESFCQIYDDWRRLQLELNWRLREISDIIRSVDTDNFGMYQEDQKNLEEKLTRIGSSTTDIYNFRKDLVRKVQKKVHTSFPHLRLAKMTGIQNQIRAKKSLLVSPGQDLSPPTDGNQEGDSDEEDLFTPVWVKKKRKFDETHNNKSPKKEVDKSSQFKCVMCPATFVKWSDMEQHLQKHTHEKPPSICEKSFKKPTKELTTHAKELSTITTGEIKKPTRSIRSKRCTQTFTQRCLFKRHISCVHQRRRRFDCIICGKAFYTKHDLETHIRTHTLERPYPCRHCHENFRQPSSRRDHERLHTQTKPFKCSHCDQRFTHSSSRVNHERIHTREVPFECDLCGRKFRKAYHRYRHVQEVHKGITLRKLKSPECTNRDPEKVDEASNISDEVKSEIILPKEMQLR